METTRRSLARMIAAATAVPFTAPGQALPNDDDLKVQHDQMRSNAELIAKVPLPMAVEPAFQFKA